MNFVDSYFYRPNFWQKLLAFLLLPFSLCYLLISILNRRLRRRHDFQIPIISIGNLVAGGSGKTPFILAVAPHFEKVAIISQGYKRKSRGLVVVSRWGEILCSQEISGDEPMLLAKGLKKASVIVCKDRIKAILKAKEMGAGVIFLDDGFRFHFKKFNILLKPQAKPYFPFCLPSGIYRERAGLYESADLLICEGRDYQRKVQVKNPTQRMILLTAIANPSRLNAFLPDVMDRIYLPDHSQFDKPKLQALLEQKNATSFLVTQKDAIKLEDSHLPLSLLELELVLDPSIIQKIQNYIAQNAPILCDNTQK